MKFHPPRAHVRFSADLARERRLKQGGGGRKQMHRRPRASAEGLAGVSAQHAAGLRAAIFALLAVVAWLIRKVFLMQQEQQKLLEEHQQTTLE